MAKMHLQQSLPAQEYLYAVLGLAVLAILMLALSKRERGGVLHYLYSWVSTIPRGRRISSAKTPPRSLSPEKKVPNNAPPPADYKDVFPASSREAITQLMKGSDHFAREGFPRDQASPAEFTAGLIPFTADYRTCEPSTYTPMEISIDEIRALGDFPDYATLSGVPLPKKYEEFKIETALPRPYRPFRWSYHQTMCISSFPCEYRPITDRLSHFKARTGLVA